MALPNRTPACARSEGPCIGFRRKARCTRDLPLAEQQIVEIARALVVQCRVLVLDEPTVAVGLELDVIAAVVIGGGSLSGGEGSVLGSVVGALIMTVIRAGCSQMGLPNWVQEIVTGAIIVIAVSVDRFRQK